MTRDDAVRSIAAWLKECDDRTEIWMRAHPDWDDGDKEAQRAELLIRYAAGYGLALTADDGSAL